MRGFFLRNFCGCALLLLPGLALAWSAATAQFAQRAEAEFDGRLVIVASAAEAQQRGLPADARREMRSAEQSLFRRVSFKGVITPFRTHAFDGVRCAIDVPANAENTDAEWWTLAHETGHCVARLVGWQESLWTEKNLSLRHRIESWADAFALLALPPAERPRLAAMALKQRAQLGGDAAYDTAKAIHCALASNAPLANSLRETGAQAEQLMQNPACLSDRLQLQATQDFLTTLR